MEEMLRMPSDWPGLFAAATFVHGGAKVKVEMRDAGVMRDDSTMIKQRGFSAWGL